MLTLISKFLLKSFSGISLYATVAAALFLAGTTAGWRAKTYFVQKGEISLLKGQIARDKEMLLHVQKYATEVRVKELEIQKELEVLQNEAQNDTTIITTPCISASGVQRLNSIK